MEVYNLFVGMGPKDGYIQVNIVNRARGLKKLNFFCLVRISHQAMIYALLIQGVMIRLCLFGTLVDVRVRSMNYMVIDKRSHLSGSYLHQNNS